MFIVSFGRVVTRYSGVAIVPLDLLGLVGLLLLPRLNGYQKYYLAIAYYLPLLVVGLACLTRPYAVQQYFLLYYAKYPVAARLSPFFSRFVRSNRYIVSIRACAVLALLTVVLILHALAK
jgi:hypothetical protein